ncbi:MAG: outer membrane beta-barrel protein [Saprospiraceae bacterium]|nr:outer membrane beta-barrel protein [Saprospiraceae bacterium]
MLDNRNSGLDPSFIDNAWEDMRRQLDEAMPVESKKRRPVLAWWWWGAALLLPIMIGLGLYPRTAAPKLQALPIPGQGKAIAGPQIQQQMAPVEAVVDIENSTHSSLNSSIKPPVISKRTLTTNSPVSPQIVNDQATKSIVDVKPQSPTRQEPALEPKRPNTQAGTPKTLTPAKNIASNRQLLPLLEAIPTALTTELPTDDLSFQMDPKASPVNSRYMLEMGTSTRSFLALDGFFIGLNKEWQRTESRWSFGAGIHYRQQILPFETSDLLKVRTTRSNNADQLDSPINQEANTGGFEYVDFSTGVARFASGDSSINVPINSLNLIQRLHYLEIPTQVNYKLGRRWETFASVRFSYLAKAYLEHTDRPVGTATEDFAFNNNGGGSGQVGVPPLSSYANDLDSNIKIGSNTNDFHRFMLSGAIGFTYYPSPRMGWRLQYSSTPVSLYNIGSINIRDQWLGTSLIWRFGGR